MKTLLVVEGKTDIQFLESFLDCDFYSVNGSAVSSKDLDFIRDYKATGGEVIILTDPDYPGTKIRDYINGNIPGLKNAYVRKEVSIKHHKVGVAESTKSEVLLALKYANTYDVTKSQEIWSIFDLIELGLVGKEDSSRKRKFISENFHLGFNNGKSFLKKLNMLEIKKEDVIEALRHVK